MIYDFITTKFISKYFNEKLQKDKILNIFKHEYTIYILTKNFNIIFHTRKQNLYVMIEENKQYKIKNLKQCKDNKWKNYLPMQIKSIEHIDHERVIKFNLISESLLYYNKEFYLYINLFNKWPNLILTDTKNIVKIAYTYTQDIQKSNNIIIKNYKYELKKQNNELNSYLQPYHKLSFKKFMHYKYLKKPIIILKNNTLKGYSLLELPEDIKNTIQIEQYDNINNLTIKLFKEYKLNQFKNKLIKTKKYLQKEKKKKEKKLEKQRKELNNAKDNFNLYLKAGNYILVNLNKIKEKEYITIDNIKIKIDKDLKPSKLAEKFFKKYKKLKNRSKSLLDIIKKTEEEIKILDNYISDVDIIDNEQDLEEIIQQINSKKPEKKQKNKQYPNFIKINKNKYTIYIGKNEIQSSYILSKIASNEDLWLHVRDAHGGHVIIKSPDKKFSNDIIEYAAKRAAYYSKLRKSEKVDIDYTLKKYIKKKKGHLAFVIYKNFKTIKVKPEKEDFT